MKLNTSDWHILRFPLLVLLVALLSGSALVFYTARQLDQSGVALKKQQVALHEASDRLHKSGAEKDRILRYRATFLGYQQHGLIGEEQRINWVDALREASLRLKMFGVSYQVEAQQDYQSPSVRDVGPYRLHQSIMKVSLGLLHEEDLPRFMSALIELNPGFFIIRECDIQRLNSGRNESVGVQPNLSADCSLAWLTMSEEREGEKP